MDAPKILTRLDVYKDGGSVSASFACGESSFTLIFYISCNSGAWEVKSDKPTRALYTGAELKEVRPVKWTSPTTGITYDDTKNNSREMSWEKSMEILRELEPQMKSFKSDYFWVVAEMLHVAANHGIGTLRQ